MLVLFLIVFCCLRVFFIKNSKIDAAASLAPAAFAVAAANIFIWEVSFQNLLLLGLSFLVLAANVRALIRLSARLYIDRYSGGFVIFSTVELVLAVCAAVFVFLDRPVKVEPGSFSSARTVSRVSGSVSRGFETLSPGDFFFRSSGMLYTFSPKPTSPENKDALPLVLFCGSDLAEVYDYEPYLLFLSQKGYEVLAADFYAKDAEYYKGVLNSRILRRFLARNSLAESKKTEAAERTLNIVKSYKALFDIARKGYGEDRTFYFVFDSLDFNSISSIIDYASTTRTGFFVLSRVDEYKTPGLGFVEQTDIPLAKEKGLERDKSLFIPRYVAAKTEETFEDFRGESQTLSSLPLATPGDETGETQGKL